jgi:drug/metabolite transporter (DMT)-like permease
VSDRDHRDQRVAYLLLIGMAAFFGGTWVAGRWAVDELPVFAVAALRFGVASALLLAWVVLRRRRLATLRPGDLPLVLGLGLTAVAGYNWFFLTGLTLAPATDGSILVPGTIPMLTTILAVLLLAERIGRRAMIGIVVAMLGLLVVIGPAREAGGARLTGDILFLASAGVWSTYNILVRVASRRFDAISATLYAMICGTLLLAPMALLEGGGPLLVAASATAWLSIAYLAVFGSILAFVFLQVGVARIGAARASAFTLLVPLFGVGLSVLFLGERPTAATVAGGMVVLIGLWLIQTDRSAARRPPVEPIG